MTDDDIEVEDAPPPTDADLARVATLADRQRAEEREVIRLTELLRTAIIALRQTREVDLPEAMRAVGMQKFTLTDGTAVALEDKLTGTKLTDPEGLRWVEEHGGSSLIRTMITIELDRGDLEKARELLRELQHHRSANSFKTLTMEESVHQSTIASFARELAEHAKARGEEGPPLETLGVHRRVTTIVGRRPKSVELTGLAQP